jgi:hypothetical protein
VCKKIGAANSQGQQESVLRPGEPIDQICSFKGDGVFPTYIRCDTFLLGGGGDRVRVDILSSKRRMGYLGKMVQK